MIYSGKNAVVLGLGHSGEAAAILLAEEGATVTVCNSADDASLREKAAKLEAQGVRVLLGPAADSDPTPTSIHTHGGRPGGGVVAVGSTGGSGGGTMPGGGGGPVGGGTSAGAGVSHPSSVSPMTTPPARDGTLPLARRPGR